jgi:hypothetical protein
VAALPTYIAGTRTARARSRVESDDARVQRLTKYVRAQAFQWQFGKWLQQVQERLHVDRAVGSTLAALRVWANYHFYNKQRFAIVRYVTKQLQRCVRESAQHGDTQVLRGWIKSLEDNAEKAAEKLRQVQHMCCIII